MGAAKKFDTFSHLERLLADFDQLKASAQALQTPNSEDDEFIRCGIVGFAQNMPADRWEYDHFLYVRTFRDEVAGSDFSADWIRFTCLAAGYFLALAEAKVIGDVELRLAEAHTPGFMWLKCEAFEATPPL